MTNMTTRQAVQDAEQLLGVTPWYSILHHDRWVKTLALIERLSPPSTHRRLLDIGVWPGYQSLALHLLGYEVMGTDLDPHRLPALPFPVAQLDLNVSASLPGAPQSQDMIVATEIIEHLEPQRVPAFFSAAHEVLRPGGCLVMTTPNRNHLGARFQPRVRGTDAAGHGHTHEYAPQELRHLLAAGWRHVTVRRWSVYGQVGTVSTREYYRPLWAWWRHGRRLHNGLKLAGTLIQAACPPVRDTLVVVARS